MNSHRVTVPVEPAEAGDRIVGTIAHVSSGRSELPELIASASAFATAAAAAESGMIR